MFAARVVIEPAQRTLLDEGAVAWTVAELLGLLTLGILAVLGRNPAALSKRELIDLVPGAYQELPDDGEVLLDVYGNASGQVVTQIDRQLLGATDDRWLAATPTRVVEEFATDVRDPARFLVSPPNDGTGQLMVLYGASPPMLATLDTVIPMANAYQPILYARLLADAWGKNSRRGDPAKESFWSGQYAGLLEAKMAGQTGIAPKYANQSRPT